MKIIHKEINFEDARGTITDIFVQDPQDHATLIFSKKGAVRGNHYHNETVQSDFVISGKLKVLTQKVGASEITESEVGPNDYISHDKREAHTYVALEDTVFITFNAGPRGGENYEKDTFRLEVPLA